MSPAAAVTALRPALLPTGRQRLGVIAGMLVLGVALAALAPAWAATVVAGLAAILLSATSPVWAIALALAAMPFELFVLDLGPVGLGPVQIVVLLAVAMAAVEMLATRRTDTPRTPLDAWIWIWLAAGFLGAIGAYDPAAAIKKAGMAVVFGAFFLLVVAKVRRTETVATLMKVLVASSAVVGGYGIWVSVRYLLSGVTAGKAMIVGSEGLAVPRAGSTLGQPTVLAALMVLALPVAVVLVLRTKGWERFLAAACGAVILVTLGFTFTRGAWLGAAAGLVILAFDRRMRGVLVATVLLIAVLSPEIVFERALTSTNTQRAEISHRFDFWNGALRVAERRPLFGAGIDNFRFAYSRLPTPETALVTAGHPHNLALDLLADTGVVGLLSFAGMIAGALTLLLRRRRSDPDIDRRLWRLAIAAALVGTLVNQTTDSLLLEPTWNAVLWTMLGLSVVLGLRWGDEPEAAGVPGLAR